MYIFKGPLVMELDTYRYYGHSMSDPGKRLVCEFTNIHCVVCSYRKTEDVQKYRKEKDPITTVQKYIIQGELATEDELKDIKKAIQADIKEAVHIASAGTELPLEELYTNIYNSTPAFMVRGCDPFTWGNSESITN